MGHELQRSIHITRPRDVSGLRCCPVPGRSAGLAREQGWGTRFTTYHLLIDDVSGLSSGQEIRLSGLPIGQVGSLTLQNDASVRVELNIDQSKAALVGERSRASLGQVGLIGDSYVSISPDPKAMVCLREAVCPFNPNRQSKT